MSHLLLALLVTSAQVAHRNDTIWVPIETKPIPVAAPQVQESALERVMLMPSMVHDPSAGSVRLSGRFRTGFIVEDESGWERRLVLDDHQGPGVESIFTQSMFLAGETPIYLATKAGSLALVAGARVFRVCDEPRAGGQPSLELSSAGDRWAARVTAPGTPAVCRTFVDTGVFADGPCTVRFSPDGRRGAIWRPDRRMLNLWGEPRSTPPDGTAAEEFTIPAGETLLLSSVSFSPSGELAYLTRAAEGFVRMYVEGRPEGTSSFPAWPSSLLPYALQSEASGSRFDPSATETFLDWPFGSDIRWIPVVSSERSIVPAALLVGHGAGRSAVLVGGSEWMLDGPVREVLSLDPERGPFVVRERGRSEAYVTLGDRKGPVVNRIVDSAVVNGAFVYVAMRDSLAEGADWRVYDGIDARPMLVKKDLVDALSDPGRSDASRVSVGEAGYASTDALGRASPTHLALTRSGHAVVHFGPYVIAVPLSSSAERSVTILGEARDRVSVLAGAELGPDEILWACGNDVHVGNGFLCNAGDSPSVERLDSDRIRVTGSERVVTLDRRKIDELPAVQSSRCSVEPVTQSEIREELTGMAGQVLMGALNAASLDLTLASSAYGSPNNGSAPEVVTSIPLSPRLVEALRARGERGYSAPAGQDLGDAWKRWYLPVRLEREEDTIILIIDGFSWEPEAGARTPKVLRASIPTSLQSGPLVGIGPESRPFNEAIWPSTGGLRAVHQSWAGTFLVTVPWSSISWSSLDEAPADAVTRPRIPPGKLDRRR